MENERRRHRRLPIQLPLVCRDLQQPDRVLVRSKTINVSTGGLYFETLADDIYPGQSIAVELTIPPGDGYFPYQGRVTASGNVVRVEQLAGKPSGEGLAQLPRQGVGATFDANMKLSF